DPDVLGIDAHRVDAADADAAVLHRRADLEAGERDRRLLVANLVAIAALAEAQAGEDDEPADEHGQPGGDEDAEADLLGAGDFAHVRLRTSRADGAPRISPAGMREKNALISGWAPRFTSASGPSAMTWPLPSMSALSAMRSMLASSWVTTTIA